YQTADGSVTWSSITNPDPPPNGRIPFVAVNDRAGAAFDLWFGDVRLYRASCSTPSSGTAPRCPANTWTQSDAGAHNDVGDVAFAAGAAGDACPVLFSSDGGVYRNTATANPACQTPAWTQPNVTPHALRVYSMAGVRRAGAANEELYLGLQDNGSFATVNLGAAAPSWTNVDCCDVYSIATDAVKVMSSWVGTSIFLRDPGLVGAMTPLTNPPPGFLIATRYLESLVSFGPSSYAAVTTTGIHVTTDGGATWTQLGAASTPFGAKNIWVSGSGSALTFHVQGGDGSGRNADAIYKFLGTGAGSWQPVNPPGGVGGFNVFAVDRRFPNNLFASHVQPSLDPAMVRSSDGGVTWSHIPALDNLMTGGGAFRYRNTRGPVAYGNSAQPTLNGYPMPSLVFIDSVDNRVMVAGGAESGVFLSLDGGSTWETITDPLTPSTSGTPHLPRPVFAYVDRDASLVINPKLTVYIGTDGRGVWRFTRSEPRNIYEICGDGLRAQCIAARLDRGLITLDCASDPRRCRFTDLLPNNCRLKWSCPPCRAGGLCPPFYDIYFDGLDLDLWEVALYARMQQVPHEVFRTATGAVLSFQPSREMFRDDVIGGFTLVFALKPAGKAGTFPIRTRLEVADRPYSARVPSRPGNLRVLPP
ncbi:MAG: hypothetical protein ACRENU_02525, partial [Gemmatimonadaceae bacterium]